MPKRTRPRREGLLELLRDRHEAAAHLNAAEESGDMLLVALRNVAEALQMSKVAAAAGVSRESLYRMLSETGNPTHESLKGICKALGLRRIWVVDTPTKPGAAVPVGTIEHKASTDVEVEQEPSIPTDNEVLVSRVKHPPSLASINTSSDRICLVVRAA